MPLDPYTSDSGYLRFHLVRMIADKLSPISTVGEAEAMLDALAKFVSGGTPMPDDDEAEDDTPVTRNSGVTIVPASGGQYL